MKTCHFGAALTPLFGARQKHSHAKIYRHLAVYYEHVIQLPFALGSLKTTHLIPRRHC